MKERSFWITDWLEFRINDPNGEWLLGIYTVPVTHYDIDNEGEIGEEKPGYMVSLGLIFGQLNIYR